MSLIGALQKYLPLGRKPTLPRGETLALRPVRNSVVAWEPKPDDGSDTGTRLTVPRRQDRLGRLLGRVFPMPGHKTIELDEFGAQIWEMCDGAHTVEQLVTHTCKKYKLNRRQGEVSVVAFMKMLSQRRLVGFLTHDSVKEKERTHGNARPQRQRRPVGARRRH